MVKGDWGTLAVLVTPALYPCRSAVDMAIDKSETTAMQWLKEQTQDN